VPASQIGAGGVGLKKTYATVHSKGSSADAAGWRRRRRIWLLRVEGLERVC
jgi:hypothetical protein